MTFTVRIYLESEAAPHIARGDPMLLLTNKLDQAGIKPLVQTYGILWTEAQASPYKPSQLIINTKPTRFTYDVPQLVLIEGRTFVFSGLVTGGSGVLRAIDKHLILIET